MRLASARLGLAAAAWAALAGPPAGAHEFIVKPTDGGGFEVLSTHVFMKGEELEKAESVEAALLAGDGRKPLPLRADEARQVYLGSLDASEAPAVLWGHRKGQIWSLTPEGRKPVPKGTAGSSDSRLYEKFSKALLGPGAHATVAGDRLEIVAVDDPAAAAAGADLRVKVLLDGQPLATKVWATYDGFSPEASTYAYYTEGREDGTATVKLTAPGTWMVRVEHIDAAPTDRYDAHVMRSVLLFEVKG